MAVEINAEYLGQLTCKVTHGPSNNELKTTAPLDNGGTGEYFSPTDLLATSLATCKMTIMGLWANKHGIDLGTPTFRVEKHMTDKAPRKIARLVVEFSIAASVPENKRESLEHAAHTCPVALSLHPDVNLEVSFNYVE